MSDHDHEPPNKRKKDTKRTRKGKQFFSAKKGKISQDTSSDPNDGTIASTSNQNQEEIVTKSFPKHEGVVFSNDIFDVAFKRLSMKTQEKFKYTDYEYRCVYFQSSAV